ncbi:BCCT family transporter, partial [Deltaproteobacteria bacterium OttesenSCG-928-K17]|nr:BCCT family transporter [Deltaproteobacteria bacterium OttesenSCG-928-K17]
VYMYVGLVLFVLLTGGTIFILNNTLSGIGAYLDGFIADTFYLEPIKRTGWVGGWTIFYWAWWLTAAPIVGLFLVKLSQGRTIRQFMLMNMLAPSLFTFLWFGVFGSAAINMEFFGGIKLSEEIASQGIQVALFALLKNLPFGTVTMLVGLSMIVVSFITMADAMTLALADMTAANYGEGGSPVILKIFWGGMMGLIALALLLSGGLQALQTSVVVCGVPILFVQLCMAVAFVKAMVGKKQYDLVGGTQKPDHDSQLTTATIAKEAV